MLENKRYSDLHKSAVALSVNMVAKARCPVCTLMPPCKHYDSQLQIVSSASKILSQPSYKDVISIAKRDQAINQLR
jgi:hypothetical protein